MRTSRALGMALLPALLLTACSSAKHAASSATTASPTPSATAASPSPSAVAATHSSSAAPPSPPPSATATASAAPVGRTTPAPPKGPSRCVSSSLRASLGQSEGTAGSIYTALVLTNRGSVACTLDGYPGVSFTAGTDAHQVGSPAKRDNRYRAALLLLAPGATAHTTVKVADHSAYDPATCLAVPANGFRIYPPGSTGSLLVRAPQQVCSKPGVQGFEKSAVRRGTVAD